MQEGISIEDACAANLIGTQEDFERNCNPDGTVKQQTETTTFTFINSENSITIENTYLEVGLVVAIITIVLIWALVFKKLKRKSSKKHL